MLRSGPPFRPARPRGRPERVRWWEIPGALALVVVLGGGALWCGLFVVLSYLIHGEWPW